jgi:hypothetical protein
VRSSRGLKGWLEIPVFALDVPILAVQEVLQDVEVDVFFSDIRR